MIHRFIYECFKGDIIFEIDHIDNDKKNNHIDNLQDIPHPKKKKMRKIFCNSSHSSL